MKKIKFLSIGVILLSVIALGIYMGKQMFKFLEAKSTSSGSSQGTVQVKEANSGEQTLVLYSAASTSVSASAPTNDVPSPIPLPTVVEKTDSTTLPASPVGWMAFSNGAGINVRSGPGLKHKKLWKISQGTGGEVISKKDGWTEVKWTFNKKIGWVRDDLLTQGPKTVMQNLISKVGAVENVSKKDISEATRKALKEASKVSVVVAKPAPTERTVKGYSNGKDLPKEGTITADPLANIRSEPNTQSAKVGRVPKGVVVKIKSCKLEGRYHWFKISFSNGRKEGWTREDNLKF